MPVLGPVSGLPTYTANLCPIHCGRAASRSDDAPPFCKVKVGTAGGFSENLTTNLRSPADRVSRAFTSNTARMKKKMRAYRSVPRALRPTNGLDEGVAVLKRRSARTAFLVSGVINKRLSPTGQ